MVPTTHSVTAVAPIIVLGMVLGLLMFFPIPVPNRDIAMTIVAGLLGYLSRGERAQAPPPSDPPADPPKS